MTTESDPLAAFRAELRRCREDLGLNYVEAGKRAGISAQRWQNIERGYEVKAGIRIPANPRRDNLIKMARAVEIPVQDALRLAGFGELDVTETRRLTEAPRDELKHLINDLTETQVRSLLGFVQSMLDPRAGPGSTYHSEIIAAPPEVPNPRDTEPANGNS